MICMVYLLESNKILSSNINNEILKTSQLEIQLKDILKTCSFWLVASKTQVQLNSLFTSFDVYTRM